MSTVTTSIERPLTEPELAEVGKQQARLLQDIGELVMQKKVAVDEFKSAIGEKQKQVEDISKRINLGLDRQDIECDVLLDTPEKGRKSFVAVASGQIVKVEEMTAGDYQSRLFDPDERPDSPDNGPGSRPPE
ncbi:MAG: hypothetical protein JOZ62_06860 [Acidobacteriaceae bacterium]|nr:hypothetical protein [Acidobacteriaceae bacterium]